MSLSTLFGNGAFRMARPAFFSRRAEPAGALLSTRRRSAALIWSAWTAAALTVATAGGAAVWYLHERNGGSPLTTPQDYLSASQLEERYGIRITLIGVTAAGGIVDFRYKIIDPEKAAQLLHDPARRPTLTAVDSGLTLSPTQMGMRHGHAGMKKGAVPFTFYPNVRGAIRHGTRVSAAFGDIRVEPIAAQ